MSLLEISLVSFVSLIPVMYYTLPMALMLSCIYRYAHFVQDRERDILYSAGIAPWSLAWPGVKISLYFVGVLYSISFWGGQKISRYLQIKEQKLKQVLPHHWLTPGIFFSIGNTTLYIHNKRADGTLEGVFLHDPKPKRTLVFSGKYGNIQQDLQDFIFTLYHGTCHVVARQERRAPHVMSFKTYTVRVPHHKKISLLSVKPQSVSFLNLWRRVQENSPELPWVRELYTRCLTPLWMIPDVLWITWVILTLWNVNVKGYYGYLILFSGLIGLQAIPLRAVCVWNFWEGCAQIFWCIPGILWIKLIFVNRNGEKYAFNNS
ncbi:putative permease [Holospora obtusa F1]|uniref:Permease n=1 Tax=Holospora obtusa F1 TaxID=1399147 RepID=W6TGD9_HOLOB|nr:putative permease [Holospora obtusa F1]